MNRISSTIGRRSARELSDELCELFGQQFAALQQGKAEAELEQYLERRKQIHQLQTELKACVRRPS
jgi:hypothetical protein